MRSNNSTAARKLRQYSQQREVRAKARLTSDLLLLKIKQRKLRGLRNTLEHVILLELVQHGAVYAALLLYLVDTVAFAGIYRVLELVRRVFAAA